MVRFFDDVGAAVPLASEVSRVVSLVPSLTEALALSCPEKLVAATDWCTHPADLVVARVRGTKNPDLEAIRALAPDLVVANAEENREVDLRCASRAGDSGVGHRYPDGGPGAGLNRNAAAGRGRRRHQVVGPGAGLVGADACGGGGSPVAGGGADLASAVDAPGQGHLRRGRVGSPGGGQRPRRGPGALPAASAWADTRGGSGGVARRALPVQQGGRPGGVRGHALRAGQRPVPDLVRASHGRGAASTARVAACRAGLIRSRWLPTWERYPQTVRNSAPSAMYAYSRKAGVRDAVLGRRSVPGQRSSSDDRDNEIRPSSPEVLRRAECHHE